MHAYMNSENCGWTFTELEQFYNHEKGHEAFHRVYHDLIHHLRREIDRLYECYHRNEKPPYTRQEVLHSDYYMRDYWQWSARYITRVDKEARQRDRELNRKYGTFKPHLKEQVK